VRYINLKQVYVPSEWLEHAAELIDELSKMTPQDRSKALSKKNYAIWRLLRKLLERISCGKCFYSDAEVFGAEGEVDHFRPKLGVYADDLATGTSHEGYWQLAYLVENLRFASQKANRWETIGGTTYGKGTRFPLRDPQKRACCEAELCNEEPILLDPTNERDVALLGFNDAGEAEPSTEAKTDFDKERVKVSIQVYHLDTQKVKRKRGDLCLRAMELARKLDQLEDEKPWDKNNRREVIKIKIELYEMLQPHAEFSSAVRYVLQPFSTLSSVQEVLSHSIK
jgi:hypothetical protein